MRSITAGVQAELSAQAVQPFIAVALYFDAGTTRLWGGLGTIAFGGETYLGAGTLGTVSAARESAKLEAHGITLGLSGIPSYLVALALAEPYQGRKVTVYLGFLSAAGVVIPDPLVLWEGRMDTMELEDGAETASIALQCESRAIAFKRSRERRWTHEEQQTDYAGDRGFEYVAGLQDKRFVWRPG